MPRRMQTGIDAELLQADVMRFMAIIAFCLIAILALVRNIDAPAISEPLQVQAANPSPAPQAEPEPKPTVTLEPPAPPPFPDPIPEVITLPVAELGPPEAPEPALLEPIAPAPPPPAMAVVAPEPAPEPELQPVIEPTPQVAAAETVPEQPTPSADPQEPGLSLRFVSDRDFLRLISKRDIQVYLFNERGAYQLSERYEFVNAQAPNQLYEVLPQTIPAAISSAARRSLGTHSGYRWGLAIPGRIEKQINAHIAEVNSGELVIDRFGQVNHVPAG